jgi:hypothetical protein
LPVHLGCVSLLPVLIQRIRDLCQPRPIFNMLQQLRRAKVFHVEWRRIAQRFEQPHRHQDPYISWLAIDHPSRLFRRQTGWQPPQHPHKLLLVLSHSITSLKSLNAGCRWPTSFTPHQAPSYVTYLAQWSETSSRLSRTVRAGGFGAQQQGGASRLRQTGLDENPSLEDYERRAVWMALWFNL